MDLVTRAALVRNCRLELKREPIDDPSPGTANYEYYTRNLDRSYRLSSSYGALAHRRDTSKNPALARMGTAFLRSPAGRQRGEFVVTPPSRDYFRKHPKFAREDTNARAQLRRDLIGLGVYKAPK